MNQEVTKDIIVKTGKYHTFFLEGGEYGIGILKVKDIIERKRLFLLNPYRKLINILS